MVIITGVQFALEGIYISLILNFDRNRPTLEQVLPHKGVCEISTDMELTHQILQKNNFEPFAHLKCCKNKNKLKPEARRLSKRQIKIAH